MCNFGTLLSGITHELPWTRRSICSKDSKHHRTSYRISKCTKDEYRDKNALGILFVLISDCTKDLQMRHYHHEVLGLDWPISEILQSAEPGVRHQARRMMKGKLFKVRMYQQQCQLTACDKTVNFGANQSAVWRCLWYLYDVIVGLSLFNADMSSETKSKMVHAIKTINGEDKLKLELQWSLSLYMMIHVRCYSHRFLIKLLRFPDIPTTWHHWDDFNETCGPNQEPFCWQEPYWETSCAESRLQWSFHTWTAPVSIADRHKTSQDVPGHTEEHDKMQINSFTIHY